MGDAVTIVPVRRVLPGGLTVVAVRRPHVHATALGAFVRAGFRHEARDEQGLAHFLEHLLFRGSNRWADSVDMSREVERLGGYVDAGVHPEMTDYVVSVHRDHWREGLDLLADLLLHPTFTDKQVELEKSILVEEMGQYTDSHGDSVNLIELTTHLMWGEGLAQADMTVLRRNLAAFGRDAVLDFYRRFYTAGNTVVVMVGDLDPEDAIARVAEVFADYGGGRGPEAPTLPDLADRPGTVFRNLDVTQVDLALGLRAYPVRHPDYPAEAVLSGVIGGGPASRLFETVREDRGLVYDIRADIETFRDVGAMTVSTTCGEANLEPTLNGIFDVLDDVTRDGITEDELQRSREMTRAAADYLLDAPFDLADWYGRVQLLDEPDHLPDPRGEAERYLAVTMDDVRRVIDHVLRPGNRYLGVIGPVRTRQKRRLEEIFRRRTGSDAHAR